MSIYIPHMVGSWSQGVSRTDKSVWSAVFLLVRKGQEQTGADWGGREPPKTGASILMTKIPHGDRESLPTWSLETPALRHMQLEMATVWALCALWAPWAHAELVQKA